MPLRFRLQGRTAAVSGVWGDVDTITTAIGKDKRIGSAYLKWALGYGGPCFPRDNVASSFFASRLGVDATLARATHKINQRRIQRMMRVVERNGFHPPAKVGILGLTYKPDTNVLEASQSLLLAKVLALRGYVVHAFDPALLGGRADNELNGITLEKSALDCVRKSELCIAGTPWEEFFRM